MLLALVLNNLSLFERLFMSMRCLFSEVIFASSAVGL